MEHIVNITVKDLIFGYFLLIIPIVILGYYKTGLVKDAIIAVARMTVQLFLLGIYLQYLFDLDLWWLNLLWAVIMIGVAAGTIGKRTGMLKQIFVVPIFTAIFISMALVDFYFLKIVLKLDNIFSARYFIPITGMIMGNCMRSNVMALDTFYKSLRQEKTLYRFLLANGATRHEALQPFYKKALYVAFNPTIANTAVIGLISLPGMMTGQILGGSSPSVAIKYQIMIMITIFVASVMTVYITIRIVNKFAFDKFDRLKEKLFV